MRDVRRILFVDLGTGASRVEEVEFEGILGLGGKVLGIRLLEEHLDPPTDPLAPENVVVLTPSRLAAYAMSGSDRFGAFTKSPLTGIWLESYCGGTFARTFCETGWEALVITGASPEPVRLHIDTQGAHVAPAADLWGKDTVTTEDEVLASLEKRSGVLSIGVAGEKLVKVACVMHDHAHTLGRGGLGAVFGSKMLKAVSATSPGALKPEAQEQFVQARREVSQLAVDSPTATTYRTWGTPVMVALLNEAGSFPTDFFSKGTAPHRATLEAEHWAEWADIEHEGCPPCPLRCRKVLTLKDGPEAGRRLHAAEYETIYTFGGSCMVEHARDVAKLSERCNILGIDTITGGNLAAIAIKARQLGIAADGPAPGDVEAIGVLLDEIAHRSTPTGEILAQGMDEALRTLGMSEWSITSKGMDPAGYDPRRLTSMALSYAVSVRGACHLRATFYKPELGGLLEGLDEDTYVQTYLDWEDRMLVMDSLTMCRFYRDILGWDRLISSVEQLNGSPVAKQDLEQLSTDTLTRIRRFNLACGLTPADDTIAERFFTEPTDRAPVVDRGQLARQVELYWVKRGWGKDGLLTD